jgi:hypothetical protein
MIRTLTEYSNHMEKRTEWQELEQLKFLTESRLLPRRIRGWVPEFTFQAESGKDAAQADRFPAPGVSCFDRCTRVHCSRDAERVPGAVRKVLDTTAFHAVLSRDSRKRGRHANR